MIQSSYELFMMLKQMDLLKNSPLYWWPNAFGYEVVVGAILTQNTKWDNVEKSLQNLRNHHILNSNSEESLARLSRMEAFSLASYITPSGFYNQKAQRLIVLSQNILSTFSSFGDFCKNVSREWLLEQKGIGMESADSILNYACNREVMVVDKYTQRLVAALGYEFESYEDLQSWLQRGIEENLSCLSEYENLSLIYARFHGKIVEFSKRKMSLNAKQFGDF